MLKIRLSQVGKKNQRSYRIVVSEKRSKRDGKNVEIIGAYNPNLEPPLLKIKEDRLLYWLKEGAQMTPTVRKLINQQ
ncbi:30S ribosomal protein S16 [Candidatus Shapirobacteria bacterium]|nr:30S ribosomal protein S16 [Candidatus Shapirobacteria bacterium]